MSILAELTNETKKYFQCKKSDLRIDNIILGRTSYTMKDSNAIFTDMNFCLVLFENSYGFSYFQSKEDNNLDSFVNKNALEILDQDIPTYFRVALIDALFCEINKKRFQNTSIFTGGLRRKATQRAKVLFDQIPENTKVLLLGAVAEFLEEAKDKKLNLKVLDLENQKIGLSMHTASIENGKDIDIEKEIKNTDYVIATGMIFVSGTADRIFNLTKKYKKPLILFMETGSNFGPQLLDYGASIVLSEFFPYYDFYGDTKYILSSKEL